MANVDIIGSHIGTCGGGNLSLGSHCIFPDDRSYRGYRRLGNCGVWRGGLLDFKGRWKSSLFSIARSDGVRERLGSAHVSIGKAKTIWKGEDVIAQTEKVGHRFKGRPRVAASQPQTLSVIWCAI